MEKLIPKNDNGKQEREMREEKTRRGKSQLLNRETGREMRETAEGRK